jgi:FlaA1/EpsC-like NDP-sugar epimerase
VLLSGNKTLRPVTVLDAAQRFAEWVVQDRQMRSDLTRFAIVRFGNVHAEAGSLIALFRKQIAAGGPVTVPHLEMSRRVMTLSHAARMILRGSAFAKGGEVFILDPGSPQNMAKIARRTIEMSGRRVAEDTRHPDDIVLKVSGLRPGEALSEPPLAEYGAVCGTPCASILQIKEVPRSEIEVAAFLREINACITNGDADRLRGLMQRQSAQFHAPVAKMRQFVDARPD